MTFSIVARSRTGAFGVAVASKFLAVGAAVPAADQRHGALATQASANLAYRRQGLALLATGVAAADVVAGLTAADPGRAERQLGVVGPTGPGASFTGADCMDWAGGHTGPDYAIQGNILAGPQVVDEMRRSFEAADPGRPLAERLVEALAAGDAAGGDRRGRQSAALLVAEPGGGYGERGVLDTGGIAVDLRVDDHPDPVTELARLLAEHAVYFGRPDPATLLDLTGPLADEVRALLAGLGQHVPATPDGLAAALSAWAGRENYEERLVPGRIDPVVLDRLRRSGGPA